MMQCRNLTLKGEINFDDCVLLGYGLQSLVHRMQTFRGNIMWHLSRVEISGHYPQTQLHARNKENPQAHRYEILEVNSSITAKQPMLVTS
jgi:hypothetical protein